MVRLYKAAGRLLRTPHTAPGECARVQASVYAHASGRGKRCWAATPVRSAAAVRAHHRGRWGDAGRDRGLERPESFRATASRGGDTPSYQGATSTGDGN